MPAITTSVLGASPRPLRGLQVLLALEPYLESQLLGFKQDLMEAGLALNPLYS